MSVEDEYSDLSEGNLFVRTFKRWTAKIKEINKRYSQPRLKMTPLVKVSLLVLRLYLIMLVIILVYKFYTVVSFR
jgi:uncharacterized membrane protein YidH (DUF202 family)